MIQPIMLWMTSKSRSSLVSKIFGAHGVWWGPNLTKVNGYDTYENNNIRALQKRLVRSASGARLPYCEKLNVDPDIQLRFNKGLANIVKHHNPWSMKTGIEYFNLYLPLKPLHIYIKRNPEDVARSLEQKGIGKYDEALKTVLWRYNYMDECQKEHGGITVNTDDIIAGDYLKTRLALYYCNLEASDKLIRDSISCK